ncbi:hypothetical protein [Pseudoalteromonas maricaloris]|uniref:Uncharacterized protein n=1 Tax=Pseudoalteromonas maricaloris TaxID=184924 RepID=A0A8I2H3C9_9GAMM|nr:hypothetical protein [Pseudoalteromonas maricaloris]NLR22376.1 hypothetical protein [Pseudoalteromonas maricaloris]WOX27984.1 hypothetical protein R5H13_15205 [Pseudoalteromonas maricaloris]
MYKKALIVINLIFFSLILSGCSDSRKIENLKQQLQDSSERNQTLWRERNELRSEISRVRNELEFSKVKIQEFQEDHKLTKDMVALLATGKYQDAIEVAKSIDQGWFDEIDRQVLAQNKLISELKRESEIRKVQDKMNTKELENDFHEFIVTSVIMVLKALIVVVLSSSFACVCFLIYKGVDLSDKLVRSAGVIGFLILYFISSFYGYSLSSLMLNSAVVSAPLLQVFIQWAVPFVAGGFFAFTIKRQLKKEKFHGERWLIVVTTLLFCMLLDVFFRVKTGLAEHDIPIANATFVVGLFITLFFHLKPELKQQEAIA